VAGSLLSEAGLNELITENDLDYEITSVNYFLRKEKKSDNYYSEKLYNSNIFTKSIEIHLLNAINNNK
jgi:hypothetical protein